MSFILDALKKSENDRQRQSGPALFEMKMAKPRSSLPTWALALAALLVVNLGVVAWLMFRKSATAAVPPMPVAAAPAVTPPVQQQQQLPQQQYSPPAAMTQQMPQQQYQGPPPQQQNNSQQNYPQQNYQQPNYPQQNYQGQQQNPQQGFSQQQQNPNQFNSGGFNSNGVGQPGPSLDERVAQANAAEGSRGGGGNPDDYAPAQEPSGDAPLGHVRRGLESGLMTYQEAATKATIPPLRLDLHVYAPDPRKRFVLVNMKRMMEGQSTPEGAKVESITTDGVVMSYRGVQFMMERD